MAPTSEFRISRWNTWKYAGKILFNFSLKMLKILNFDFWTIDAKFVMFELHIRIVCKCNPLIVKGNGNDNNKNYVRFSSIWFLNQKNKLVRHKWFTISFINQYFLFCFNIRSGWYMEIRKWNLQLTRYTFHKNNTVFGLLIPDGFVNIGLFTT